MTAGEIERESESVKHKSPKAGYMQTIKSVEIVKESQSLLLLPVQFGLSERNSGSGFRGTV